MALQGAIPIDFGTVFPDGAYAAGVFEAVRDFDRSQGRQHERRARMAKVMDADRAELGPVTDQVPGPAEVTRINRPADVRREHQTQLRPRGSRPELLALRSRRAQQDEEGRGLSPDGDEDARAQPDRLDDEHLHARATGPRTGGCRCSGGHDLRLSAAGRWLHCMAALVASAVAPRSKSRPDLEPVSGFEPLTCRLQDGCSAN